MELILLYHRIADDRWRYSVTAEHFAQHLEVLRAEAEAATLASLTPDGRRPSSAASRSRPRVAITFDDGYADTGAVAWPLLARARWPATVFVVSGHVGSRREFWWDELDWLARRSVHDARRVTLRVDDIPRVWDLVTPSRADETPDATLYRELHDLLIVRDAPTQRRLLDQLADGLRVSPPARREKLPVGLDLLRAWDRDALVEIGAHTHGHVLLPAAPVACQASEIADSRAALQEMVGHAIASFSYPYGRYTRETCRLVQAAGFTRACKVGSMPVAPGDPFTLPRFIVEDWDGETFVRHLHAVVKGARC